MFIKIDVSSCFYNASTKLSCLIELDAFLNEVSKLQMNFDLIFCCFVNYLITFACNPFQNPAYSEIVGSQA